MVADVVDGLVGPLGQRGRQGHGVGVAGGGVGGQEDLAFAVGAIHQEFDEVQVIGVAAPAPFEEAAMTSVHLPLSFRVWTSAKLRSSAPGATGTTSSGGGGGTNRGSVWAAAPVPDWVS